MPARIGIVGCGDISGKYVAGLGRYAEVEVVGCADLSVEAAERLAASMGLRAYPTVAGLLEDPAVDVVVNLTPPLAHAQVSIAALEAGKHVYTEKPLGVTVLEAEAVVRTAQQQGRKLGAAPDTSMGSMVQTGAAALARGLIGEPIAVVSAAPYTRAETWHPNPTFLFGRGGGPVLDLGPYYVTALVACLGPVETVAAFTVTGAPVRRVTAPERRVEEVVVDVPTHAAAVLRFECGVVATVVLSYEVWDSHLPQLEIYGTEGTLTMGDPQRYDGAVLVRGHSERRWKRLRATVPTVGPVDGPEQYLRGLGVADLVAAMAGQQQRASGELGLHVLEVLEGVERASNARSVVSMTTRPNGLGKLTSCFRDQTRPVGEDRGA